MEQEPAKSKQSVPVNPSDETDAVPMSELGTQTDDSQSATAQSDTSKETGFFASFQQDFRTHHGRLILSMAILIIAVFFVFYRFSDVTAVIKTLNNILRPVFWGIGLAYVLCPVMMFFRRLFYRGLCKRMENRLRAKRLAKILSIVAAMLLFFLIVVALILMIVPQLVSSLSNFIQNASSQFESIQQWIANRIEVAPALERWLWESVAHLIEELQDFVQNRFITWIGPYILSIVSAISDGVSYLIYAIVAVVIAIYALKDKEIFQGQSKKLLYALCRPEKANSILDTARHAHKIFGGYLIGKLTDSLIVGLICMVGFAILRLPYCFLLAAIICITDIIPFFGPIIGTVPCAILILLNDPVKVIPFLIFIFVLQQIDGNVIAPIIIGDTTGLSEFWITVSILLFSGLLGLLGMLIAVPLFAVIYYLVKKFLDTHLEKKKMPVSSTDYRTVDVYQLQAHEFSYYEENLEEEDVVFQRLHKTLAEHRRRRKYKKWKRQHKHEEVDDQEEIK